MERIGTVNWYWSFAGVEQRARDERVSRLREERDRVQAGMKGLESAFRGRELLLCGEGRDDGRFGQGGCKEIGDGAALELDALS